MIIKEIELENIRSYKKQLIKFSSGINFLSGDIGSGKSTILLAIEFALFGFKRGDLEGFHLLRKGEDEGNVKLCLYDPKTNENLEIFRKLKKSKKNSNISQESGYLKYNSSLEELSPSELNSHIFDILNFPKEFLTKDKNLIYRFTTYTPQEQLKEILFSDSEKKLEVIRKLFKIDKYKQLSDSINIFISENRIEKKLLESKLESKDRIDEEINLLDKEILELEQKEKDLLNKEKPLIEKIQKCKDAVLKREDFLDKLNLKKVSVEKKLSQLDELTKQNFDTKKKISQSSLELSKLDKLDIDKVKQGNNLKIKHLENDLKKIQNEKSIFLKDKENLEKTKQERFELEKQIQLMKSLELKIKDKSKEFDYILTKCKLKDAQVEIRELNKKLEKVNKIKKTFEEDSKEILILNEKIKNLKEFLLDKEKELKNFTKLDFCPTCKQNICDGHKMDIMQETRLDIKDYKFQTQQYSVKLEKLKVQIDINKHKLSKIEEDENKLFKLKEKEKYLLEKTIHEKNLYLDLQKEKKELLILKKLKLEEKVEEINLKLKESNLEKNFEELSKKELKNNSDISNLKLEISNLNNNIQIKKKLNLEIKELNLIIKSNQEKLNKKEELLSTKEKLNLRELEIRESKKKYQILLDNLFEKQKLFGSELASFKTDILNKKKILTDKKSLKEEMNILKKNLISLTIKEEFLDKKVNNISKLIEKAVFTKYYAQFNEEFEKLFKDLIEDNEIDVRLDEVFNIIIEQNGYDIDIKNLSGGEKSSLAIAYRLGLKKIIEDNLGREQKLNILILDEPTDGFSNEQIDRLGNILKESNLKQILLVSHDEKIESISDEIIHIEKVNHISTIS